MTNAENQILADALRTAIDNELKIHKIKVVSAISIVLVAIGGFIYGKSKR